MFTAWLFGRNIHEHIITCSYNELLSTNFSKSVRDRICQIVDCGKVQFACRCRKVAEEEYDKDKNYKKYIELYNNILSAQKWESY